MIALRLFCTTASATLGLAMTKTGAQTSHIVVGMILLVCALIVIIDEIRKFM